MIKSTSLPKHLRPVPALASDAGRCPMRFTLPWAPLTNNLYCNRKDGGRFLSKLAREYKARAMALITPIREAPFSGPVSVEIELFRPERRGDIDAVKLPIDCLIGIAYVDDSQICKLVITRRECPENPRVEVTVYPIERLS